ncbi:MAG: c-type cytochrome [Promethearchaeota archaeon]
MDATTRWALIIVAGVTVGLLGICLVAICVVPGFLVPSLASVPTGSGSGAFVSNGQRIYFTATSARGTPIVADMGMGMMGQGRLACVTCHGPDGRGGRVRMMMRTVEVPDIRYRTLTSGEHHEGTEKHEPYTDEAIKRAITQGLEPDGAPLQWPMPRWSMSDDDLDDLLEFLKTL